MRRKLASLMRCKPRRCVALLVALSALLALAPSASASIQFVKQWGSHGTGNGQFNGPAGHRHRLLGQRVRGRRRQQPDPEVLLLGQLPHQVGNGRLRNRPVQLPLSHRHRLLRQRVRRRRTQRPDSEVLVLGHIHRQVGKPRLGRRPVRRTNYYGPSGIATDSSGNVYVADPGNYRIQKFDSSGNFLRSGVGASTTGATPSRSVRVRCQAGSPGSGAGRLGGLTGIAADAAGNVYATGTETVIHENGANFTWWDYVQKFDSSGNYVTRWGVTGGDDDSDYGPDPGKIATDPSGNVYVGDGAGEGGIYGSISSTAQATTSPPGSRTLSENSLPTPRATSMPRRVTWSGSTLPTLGHRKRRLPAALARPSTFGARTSRSPHQT